jgi:predicted Zn-dependent protease
MRNKRIALGVAVACGFLLLGCGQTDIDRNRAQARQRWDQSRAEMVTKLAEGCYQRGEFGRAGEHMAELIRAGVTYAPAHVLAARLAAQRGDLDKARERAESAKAIDPKSPEARYVLGTIEQALGHADRALEEFREAVRLSPHEAKYVLAETELLVAQGKGDEAAKDLCEAVKRTPGRAELHSALGDVLSMLKLHGEAVGSYRAAMHLKPDLPGVKERLARALFRSGAYAEAEPLLAELAGAEPEFVSRWVRLMQADCLLAMGRAPEARTIYEAHRLLAPKTAAPLIGLAKCDILENHLALAGDRLEVVLAIQPQDPEAHALMGYVRVATGRPGEALAHLRLALDNPNCQGRRTVEQLLAQAEKVVTEF